MDNSITITKEPGHLKNIEMCANIIVDEAQMLCDQSSSDAWVDASALKRNAKRLLEQVIAIAMKRRSQ